MLRPLITIEGNQASHAGVETTHAEYSIEVY